MNWYIQAVTAHPIITAIIQFAFLGTFGEVISKWIVTKKIIWPFSFKITIWKMVVWSILAVCIKYTFTGFKGYVAALVEHHLLPEAVMTHTLLRAFAISFFTNIQFGVFMVIFHRLLDNLVLKVKNWEGLGKGMLCMIWFWIPAHTITFSLPTNFQIGLAALWSVVLGIILGFFNKK
ncbi:MAG: hypothetical protein J7K89_07535 [Candidatus Cloacimonetes bacterium]|nr:hypothetical protein [Candidatus Cloacimonadota bacterium]